MSKAIQKPQGRPMTNVANLQAKHSSLLTAEKKAIEARKNFEALIRKGYFPKAFVLEPAPLRMFVPAPKWQAKVGPEWIKENEVPQNRQAIIKHR